MKSIKKLTKKKISELLPADYNPRKIDDDALAGLTASLNKFGVVEPIVWNVRSGNIVGGHQRLKAMMAGGVKEAYVAEVDLSEVEEKQLNVTLNNPAIQGEWETEKLEALIGELRGCDDFEALRLEILDSVTEDPIERDQEEDRAGASPWERMNENKDTGTILFSFGSLTAKIEKEFYDRFCDIAPKAKEEFAAWFMGKINEICNI